MKQFLKFTLAAAFGIVLSFLILIGLIAIVASRNETNEVKLSKPVSYTHLTLPTNREV